ncbi:MAG: PRC-barrel domain-containing protein [Acidobacteriota bacterium]|nr:PRC-barrel domain-containing protein [Acidobacteriota bacterium]
MIRVTELGGRAVIDLEAAEKLGKIDRVVLDPEGRKVAGFVISNGASLFNNGRHLMLSASCVHAVGPDAITVRRDAATTLDDDVFEGLPRASDVIGRKVVSQEGRLMGEVDDVLIDETDGRIVGYTLTGEGVSGKLADILPGDHKDHKDQRAPFLRADADLRAGKDLIVAPDDAISRDWTATASIPDVPAVHGAPVSRWADSTVERRVASQWVREADGRTAAVRAGDL